MMACVTVYMYKLGIAIYCRQTYALETIHTVYYLLGWYPFNKGTEILISVEEERVARVGVLSRVPAADPIPR
jgi:hypothetical protein